jgi:vacuolar-type H+-ATPase subunit H
MIKNKEYAQQLLQEIKGLNQDDVEKILRMIHFVKNEFFTSSKKQTAEKKINILNYAGMLSDLTDEETVVFTHITKRRNLFGGRELTL